MWLVCGLTLVFLFIVCRAGPINRENLYFDRSGEQFANESVCVSDDVLYKEDDPIPTATLCERCVCRPPDIACEAIKCEKKSGCRAIPRPNECCPEYKCDCEADGKIYQNGERLEDPDSPCRVCYCQSGEIVCTVIKCYTRADCVPRYVTGKCCPKYDHCPPVDPTPMIFYTTPETLSESVKSSSVDYEAGIGNTPNALQENIQDNIVDSSKWIELLGENSDSSMPLTNTSNNYGEYSSLKPSSAKTNTEEEGAKEELSKDNTQTYTESTSTVEPSKAEEIDKAGVRQDNLGGHANETSKREEGDQENTEAYVENTSKGGEGDREGLQHDSIEANTESTVTGETSAEQDNTEGYTQSTSVREEPQQEHTDVSTEHASNAMFSTEEDKTEISSGKMKNEIAGAWSDETTTTQNHHNSGSMGEEVNPADATKTLVHPFDANGMMKDGGAVWYIGEVKKSSAESVKYETSQETERHEITTSKSKDEDGAGGTESPQYETAVSTERTLTESTEGVKMDETKYDEDNTETASFENNSTTIVPDRHTQSMEHESVDTVPVISFLNDMEAPHMAIVLPDSDNNKMQDDYDIKKTEINPVIDAESEDVISSQYSHVTNNNSIDGQNTKEDYDRTFQNSNEGTEDINTDESSLAPFTASPTAEATTEFQPTETTETIESTVTQDATAYTTKIHLSMSSLVKHDDPTQAQNEEFTSPIDESTTPDILDGEHPLNFKEFAQTTEHTETNSNEELQDVMTANSISNSNNMEESKAVPKKGDEVISRTEAISEAFTENVVSTVSSDETEGTTYSTTEAAQFSEKILATVIPFKSNKTVNISVTSDILPKEWLKTSQFTTETNTKAALLESDASQTEANGGREEDNCSLDNSGYSCEPRGRETADQSEENDITKVVSTTESTLTTPNSLDSTDKFVDNPSNRNDSQTLANEHQTTEDNDTDITSQKMDMASGERGTEMPFQKNPISQQKDKIGKWESTGASISDVIPQENSAISGDSRLGGSDETESSNYNAEKSEAKPSNKFDKIYPESVSTEDKPIDYDRPTSGESVYVKEVESAMYSSGSYEMNFHDIYGTGDYYVLSSESGISHNTDVGSVATSTVTNPSSVEQSADTTTVRSRDNDDTESSSQEFADVDTTVPPTEATATTTNRTENTLESTTPGLSENVDNSDATTDLSEVKAQNSVEDNQEANSQDTKLENESVAIVKIEQALYDLSDSQEENDSTE
ncbi:hypothetical protein B7P43_G08869 [Cryptotermes secundus]|uniref:VWFC domain-containing protein n=3 Tax=Cryptotermes secundus TaxID=105785 RepID=A0A2J7R7V9_9NEOP|nr:uncharacterized protein LOC111862886 isoform X2 [Cryptotermes secundus]PNF36911.1 hypothetical protein B7P43_G08869 [Cryptotermes secundus]